MADKGFDNVEYQKSHVYSMFVCGTDKPLKFQVTDTIGGDWGDNTGSFKVTIYRAWE